jgi:hypothetical protein
VPPAHASLAPHRNADGICHDYAAAHCLSKTLDRHAIQCYNLRKKKEFVSRAVLEALFAIPAVGPPSYAADSWKVIS